MLILSYQKEIKMKLINSKKCLLFKDGNFYVRPHDLKAWITISNGFGLRIRNIPQIKSLPEALYEYFQTLRADCWAPDQNFMKLECLWCDNTTLYWNKTDLPIAFGPKGCLVCPCCQAPWIFYEYEEQQ